MNPTPIHRRYGRGAARLPIGKPSELPALSKLARTPVARERLLAFVPGLTSAAMILLLGLTSSIPSPPSSLPIALEESALNVTRLPEATSQRIEFLETPHRAEPQADLASAPAKPDPKRRTTDTPSVVEPERSIAKAPNPPAPMDAAPRNSEAAVKDLLGAVGWPKSDKANANEIFELADTRPRQPVQRQARPSASTSRPAFDDEWVLARAPGPSEALLDDPIPEVLNRAARSGSRRPNAARPSEGSGSAIPKLSGLTQTGNESRKNFLSGLADDEASTGMLSEGPRRRPPVAANAAERQARGERVRNDLAATARTSSGSPRGWSEVALGELPDCSPAGRQDRLKQQILRSAARTPECSNEEGSFRFLETRNLNAFLMWSRPNPATAGKRLAARDVCDVLERALRCLGQAPQ